MSTALESPAAPHPLSGALHERGARGRIGGILVVAAPSLLALALCLYQITTRSLWLDESATVAIASQHGAAFGSALARDGGNMLAYYALLHVLIGWFGSGPLLLRLPAAIGTAATVAFVAMLGLRLFSRRVALVAAVLTAVSLSLVYWGQNARGYTPMIALLTASFLAFLALLEGRGGWRAWVAYVASMTAAVYLGLEAVLVVPAQLVALLWFRGRWRTVVSAVIVTAVCCIPLAVLAADRGAGQLFWVPSPSFSVLKQVVQALSSAALQPSFYTSTTTVLVVLTLLLLAAGALGTWQLARTAPGEAWRPALLLAWLLLPSIVALLESALGQSIFQARYLLLSLPPVSLLLAWTLIERPALARLRIPGLLSVAMLAALFALRAAQLAPAYGVSSENWRSATSYVTARSEPRDCVAFYPLDARMPFRYYLHNLALAPRPVLPTLPWREVRPFVEQYQSLSPAQVARLPAQCARVWLITRRGGGVGGTAISRANSIRFKRLAGELAGAYPASSTAYFGQAGLVAVRLYSR